MAQAITEEPAVINHVALYVSDLSKSTLFYKEAFHLQQIEEPFKDKKHTWFSLGAAGQMHLIAGEGAKAVQNKNDHLCFSVRSMEDFTKKLEKMDIPYESWDGKPGQAGVRADGIRQIYLKDPDGQWIEVNDAIARK